MALAIDIAAAREPRQSPAGAVADIIARDPQLPALAWLIDSNCQVEFAASLPRAWRVEGIGVEYLRYKPFTSCLAKLRLHTTGDEASAYAVAVAPSAWGKLAKAIGKCEQVGAEAVGFPTASIAIFRSPYDREIPALQTIDSQSDREDIFHRLGDEAAQLAGASVEPLSYKPERRFVGKLTRDGQPIGVLRAYSAEEYPRARKALKWLAGDFAPARCIGASDRHSLLALSWVPGRSLTGPMSTSDLRQATNTLSTLHYHRAYKLPHISATSWRRRCARSINMLAHLAPASIDLRASWVKSLEEAADNVEVLVSLHGDAHAGQFLFPSAGDPPVLIDLDNACLGPPEWDFAVLLADQLNNALRLGESCEWGALVEHVAMASPRRLDERRLRLFVASRLIELAAESFRRCERNWSEQITKLIALAASISTHRSVASRPSVISVSKDSGLPALSEALDPILAAKCLADAPSCDSVHGGLALRTVRLLRHKPGRRATTGEPIVLLGKMEAKPRFSERLATQQLLWRSGFHQTAEDGVVVAEPWGALPEWQMWLQVRVPSASAPSTLEQITNPRFLQRAAQAIAKLHRASLPLPRRHAPVDEAELLAKRFIIAEKLAPAFEPQWKYLAAACNDLIASLPMDPTTSVHRDFYSDQILLSPTQTALVDLDLICRSDPALDIGNFLGCLADRAVREIWPTGRLLAARQTFLRAYEYDQSAEFLKRVQSYAALTVARHAALSVTLPGRLAACKDLIAAALHSLESGI